ncbi:centromere protein T-like isoform X1 [Salvelinus fontinalis]|uniref:centromere protein T-like isoform X1 n=2 Tax=Salvelinus fontinalis TaxID=8038 RepID=UPI0024856059|nr:centromere protein T-like isoform X1 [Salvelinus fontinalis]XP_055755526.1 centromere protein T-like isoform X1 [Salvelinus fontinalis]XP_055755527.1 centromere protein T-like isoform X1 [Salvelinus fontinalis]XP_055755528.1 centromere protein T-like isoform X1 [Salvelinus fontinalis]XP_055755529.1 centromere protein T-like isoform X1 [Salvelinus fontinalis]XP_055755530.1 centromere protein T-like isoform X1 [Salvelinus fontinalis]XP_055755531.1 centromere protein T-like isoform X1 [Salvel
MDSVDEDVSARVLLQRVIHTESSRSPITRSASQAQFQSPGSRVRRSIRLRRSDVGALTPQEALKQSIKNKLRESTSRFSLPVPPSKRRTISEGVRKMNMPAPATASLLYDDDITPRYLLRGILQTEPETSLLVQDRPVKKEPELPYTNSSLHSNRPSTGLSDLDLPDMTTTVNLSNTVKGLSRKRPRRSLNITAFNRQLEHEGGEGEVGSATEKDLSSLSSASPSSITFSLKTPFVDVQTEKSGFQRKVTNRKKICLEEFDKALQNRQAAMGGDPELSVREDQQGLSETVRSEGFTLGLSDLTAPDITHDIITSNTALYSLPVDTATTFTITTQDKDTITGTQIQREMGGMKDEDEKDMEGVEEQNEDKMELDNKDGEDLAGDAGQREDSVRQKESKSQTEEVEAVADSQTEEEDEVAESQTDEDEVAESQTDEDEVAESQTDEDEVAESQTEEDEVAESQTEEDEVAESQTEEDEVAESQTEEDEVAESQTEEDEVAESQTEEDEVAESQTAEDEVAESQTAEGEVAESQTAEGEVAESQTEEDEVAESQTEEDEVAESQTEEDEVAESQTAEDEVAESQTAEGEVAESQTAEGEVAESQTAEGEVAESQTEDDVADEGGQVVEEGQEKRLASQSLTHNEMHISRRAYCSEGGGKVAGVIEGGRGYKSMGAALHPTETGETGWAGRRSEGDTAGEWHSGPEVGASESAHTRTVTLGSVPPSLLPQEDEQELEGLSRTGTSRGNEEMENSMPPLEMTFEPENNAPHSSNSSLHPITAQSPAEHEEDWDDVEEEDGIRSEELSMKTPAFVREKRNALPIDPLATPTVLKDLQPSVLSGAGAAVKPKAVRGKRTGSAKKDPGLSKSYIMSVFKHFAKTKVSTDVYPVLKEIMERYFDRLADDLETFAAHAKRKTIEVEDVELLMRRQGFLTDSMPVNVLIEKYLPMESRKLLIPVATSGNYVIPKPRRK